MSRVWAWVEKDLEVMGDAADLAAELGLPCAAFAAGAEPEVLAEAGAELVVALEPGQGPEAQAAAAAASLAGPAAAILLSGGAAGSGLAPRLAARLGAACLLDCARVRAAPGGLSVERWAFDDRAQELWQVPAGSCLVATLRPGGRGAPRPRPRPLKLAAATPAAAGASPPAVRELARDPRSARLAEADRIVAAGLGIGVRENLALVAELAGLLGAALGASRPLADRGWVPFERQIGTTGQTVAPRLYFAIGISGAIQHAAGMREAGTVVAVNTDPACPMMARADLAAAGDAAEVTAALNRRLRRRLQRAAG